MVHPLGGPRIDTVMSIALVEAPLRVQRAYKFALDPTPHQERLLRSNCGAARVAYNTMLAAVKANLDQRAAEKTYGLEPDELTESLGWSMYTLRKQWNAVKGEVAPCGRRTRRSLRYGCNNLPGAGIGTSPAPVNVLVRRWVPAVQSRHRRNVGEVRRSDRRAERDRHSVRLPRIGRIHTHESTAELGQLVNVDWQVNSVTVSTARSVACILQVEAVNTYRRPAPKPAAPQIVGIDLGVKDLLVVATPDGVEVERVRAPKELAAAAGRLRTLQRKAARQHGPYNPVTRTRQSPSAGWHTTQEQIRRVHARAANLRENHLHHVTTRLAKTYTVIGVEDLNITGMLRRTRPKPHPNKPGTYLRNNRAAKRGLSRSIADASFATISPSSATPPGTGRGHRRRPVLPSSKTERMRAVKPNCPCPSGSTLYHLRHNPRPRPERRNQHRPPRAGTRELARNGRGCRVRQWTETVRRKRWRHR